ncbi:DUF1129 family protein [Macrococcus equi]|uniref:DUF1129 family protein n=1 Tax=Macrococcus equi TaxID=3395462 RepID=UPI0039BEC913
MPKLNEMDVDYQRKLNQLSPSNKIEFLKVRNTLKFDFKIQEKEADNILSDILDHLIDAQNNGISTNQFFGNDTKQFTQELFDELPRNNPTYHLWYIMFIFSLTAASFLLPLGILSQIKYWITKTYIPINIFSALLSTSVFAILLTIAIFNTISSMKHNTFNSLKGKVLTIPIYWVMTFIPLVIYFLGYDKNLTEVPGYLMMIIGFPFLFITILTFKKKISY